MEIILFGLVLILSNTISFAAGRNFAPTALELARVKREHESYVIQAEEQYFTVVRQKNRQYDQLRELKDADYQAAIEATPRLTDKIEKLHDATMRSFNELR